jgi:hypothetical protein
MNLTHESGSQEDQFDEKNGGQKSRDTIPLKKWRQYFLRHSFLHDLSESRTFKYV